MVLKFVLMLSPRWGPRKTLQRMARASAPPMAPTRARSTSRPSSIASASRSSGLQSVSQMAPSTQRRLLFVEYDGTGFCGAQRQSGVTTVQSACEAALASVVKQVCSAPSEERPAQNSVAAAGVGGEQGQTRRDDIQKNSLLNGLRSRACPTGSRKQKWTHSGRSCMKSARRSGAQSRDAT